MSTHTEVLLVKIFLDIYVYVLCSNENTFTFKSSGPLQSRCLLCKPTLVLLGILPWDYHYEFTNYFSRKGIIYPCSCRKGMMYLVSVFQTKASFVDMWGG